MAKGSQSSKAELCSYCSRRAKVVAWFNRQYPPFEGTMRSASIGLALVRMMSVASASKPSNFD
jgi:hypothetical protein